MLGDVSVNAKVELWKLGIAEQRCLGGGGVINIFYHLVQIHSLPPPLPLDFKSLESFGRTIIDNNLALLPFLRTSTHLI